MTIDFQIDVDRDGEPDIKGRLPLKSLVGLFVMVAGTFCAFYNW